MPRLFRNCPGLIALSAALLAALNAPVQAEKIRDVTRLKNDDVAPTIHGIGLVVGLKGTGDGGDYVESIRKLQALLKNFGDEKTLEKELKNTTNVAVVYLEAKIPPQGAHEGEKLDIVVSALGAAKSLKGGQLVVSPLLIPWVGRNMTVAMGSGECMLDDEKHPTTARIHNGAAMFEDVLASKIKDGQFTLVLHPNTATEEMAGAIADQINEEMAAQTGGKQVAFAIDRTSVDVIIPQSELKNVNGFVARVRNLPLPRISEPAKVIIDTKTKTITFSDEVELSATNILCGGMTITISDPPPAPATTPGTAAVEPRNTKLRDLIEAFRLYKIRPDDQIAIVKQLYEMNALKAELEIQ